MYFTLNELKYLYSLLIRDARGVMSDVEADINRAICTKVYGAMQKKEKNK